MTLLLPKNTKKERKKLLHPTFQFPTFRVFFSFFRSLTRMKFFLEEINKVAKRAQQTSIDEKEEKSIDWTMES